MIHIMKMMTLLAVQSEVSYWYWWSNFIFTYSTLLSSLLSPRTIQD